MFIIVDYRIDISSLKTLQKYGEVLHFKTESITYDSISSHPDIFIFQNGKNVVLAPNIPKLYIDFFEKHEIQFSFGNSSVGISYPFTAFYNAAAGAGKLIFNPKTIDPEVLVQCQNLEKIVVKQGYTRCNTMIVKEEITISSNLEIVQKTKGGIYFPPENIQLEGLKHGFIGGCLGFHENKLFVNGSLKYFYSENQLQSILEAAEIEVIELNNRPLHDVGSILFV